MGVNAADLPDSARAPNQSASSPESRTQPWHPYGTVLQNHYHEDAVPAYTEHDPRRPYTHPVHQGGVQHQQENTSYETQRQLQPQHNYQTRPPLDCVLTHTASLQRLQKPIVIPATAASLGSPFLRAYPPALEDFHIPRDHFLSLVDGLNRAIVKSPPLQVLSLVGNIVGFVPLQTAQIVGGTINAAATLGAIAISKGATEVFLRKANQETFAPRGLKIAVAKLEAVAQVTGMAILDATGKIREDVQLLDPLRDLQQMQTIGAAQRWLQCVEPWVERLDLEVPLQANMDTNLLGRLHTLASERDRKKSESKTLKDRSKAYNKQQKEVDKAEEHKMKVLSKLERAEEKARGKERSDKLDDKIRKIDQKREKAEIKHQKELGKASEDFWEKDKESKAMRKVLWLVIHNIDM
ncbi:hypothetical protein HD806DRAFT_491323 [Xylariaceae sp. AK1471]|nr:hypothetical protein HD806DRAFT_491323 [Xylariaceae sp. AK1471]